MSLLYATAAAVAAAAAAAAAVNMPIGGVQGQNPTQGLVHWMSAVMAEHMTGQTHHDPGAAVGMHYMWNGNVDVSMRLTHHSCVSPICGLLSVVFEHNFISCRNKFESCSFFRLRTLTRF